MSEIDTSAEAAEELCGAFDSTTWHASERDNTLVHEAHQLVSVVRALAAERDALAARVEAAGRMAGALTKIAGRHFACAPHQHGMAAAECAETALAAWRAAKEVGDGR